jgi:hypothetical protein
MLNGRARGECRYKNLIPHNKMFSLNMKTISFPKTNLYFHIVNTFFSLSVGWFMGRRRPLRDEIIDKSIDDLEKGLRESPPPVEEEVDSIIRIDSGVFRAIGDRLNGNNV